MEFMARMAHWNSLLVPRPLAELSWNCMHDYITISKVMSRWAKQKCILSCVSVESLRYIQMACQKSMSMVVVASQQPDSDSAPFPFSSPLLRTTMMAAASSSRALNAILPQIPTSPYEAHQKARTFASRYVKSNQYDTAIDVLFQSARELFKTGQPGSGSDLTTFLLDVYETKGEPVNDESRGKPRKRIK